MQVAKWGNSLAVRLPVAVVEALELREGDDIELHVESERSLTVVRKPDRDALLARLASFRGRLPADFKFAGMRRMAADFIDTNVLLYQVSTDPIKAKRAEALVRAGGMISVQVLNELTNVARRKMGLDWAEVRSLLETVRALLDVIPLDTDIHEMGLHVCERYGFSVYDGMIVAAAVRSGCDVLWSEDMQNGLRVEGRLTIRNPFVT